ncbi:MAG: LytR family transcriptional regulator [Spirochaetaceae bacterium]|nr:MAG: LytR family transcriptional regulator [Spirochaetaceae bacterium]
MRAHIDTSIVFLLLILALLGGTFYYVYLQVRGDAISDMASRGEQIPFLLIIGDEGETPLLTQVLIYDTTTDRAAIFDVPGETGAVMTRLGRTDRIDELFRLEGTGPYLRQISELMSLDISIYLHWSRSDIETLVDFLGGLELFLGESIEDFETPDPVLLPAGNVRLEGPKALTHLSYERLDERPVDTGGRRQSFTEALIHAITRSIHLIQSDRGLQVLNETTRTNLDARALASLTEQLSRVDIDRVIRQRIIGTYRSVEVTGEPRLLLFPHFEGQWLRETVNQVSESLRSVEQIAGDRDVIVLQILNGTEVNGLARRTRELFQGLGIFDVREFGNAEHSTYRTTEIIDHRGDERMARRVAGVIRADRIRTEISDDPAQEIDVTIVLGQDFDGRYVRQ